ncbi:hypothetical protein LTR27_004445 [Elasticomyces elasticus]|nr:hypothetical protein LTR27_004445 [Elasticomyces elasticus]
MFECSACTLRALRAVAPTISRRSVSTAVATSSNTGGAPYLNAAQLRHSAKLSTTDPFVPIVRRTNVDVSESGEKELTASRDRAIRKELQWLTDPAKLADHVHYVLRCDNPEKALELVRMASNKMQCVVSWNHCLDYFMKDGKVAEAMKVYNDMKKRAQFPDSYTYTLLLRGLVGLQAKDKRKVVLAEHVSKAVSLYHSMSSPTSRVQPSIIHTNAALKVCAFGGDMDAVWGIVAKIPERGPGAADVVTYSILLNAIRHDIQNIAFDAGPEAAVAQRDKGLQEARRVWMEVVARWRGGLVKMDEELVCAMARVLLASQRLTDWDDVLSLVHQTMQIERLIAPYGSAERQIGHVPQISAPAGEVAIPSASEQEDQDGYVQAPAAKAFKPVNALPTDRTSKRRTATLAYVEPANDTLSILIEACTLMRTPKTASAYWALLTGDEYGISPDIQNFNSQLRLMHKNRASAQAAKLLTEDLVKARVDPMYITFRIAMDTCSRDHKNSSALEHATSILGVMEKKLSEPDVETMKKYLSLALTTDSGPKVVGAIDRLDSLIHSLRSRLVYGPDPGDGGVSPQKELRFKNEALAFVRMVVGAIDTLIERGLVPREDFGHWLARKGQLSQMVGRGTRSAEGSERRLVEGGKLEGRWGYDGFVGKRNMVARRRVVFDRGELKKFRRGGGSVTREVEGGRVDAKASREMGETSDGGARRRTDDGRPRRVVAGEDAQGFGDSPSDIGM